MVKMSNQAVQPSNSSPSVGFRYLGVIVTNVLKEIGGLANTNLECFRSM